MTEAQLKRFENAIRESRDNALDAAIRVCVSAATNGQTVGDCIKILCEIKEALPRPEEQ